jgi:hypothetical protein
MGISIAEISKVVTFFDGRHPRRVLDIGAQNLVNSAPESIVQFITTFTDAWNPDDLAVFADAVAVGSSSYPWGTINGAWLGDLLSRAGMEYRAYDIFAGPRTTVCDLNSASVPGADHATFDLVLNCGTSEHVLNQYNVFRVMHDAVKVGGIMYHAVPMTGYLNDGYFAYTPSFFRDLANTNLYEIVDIDIRGPGETKVITDYLDSIALFPDDTAVGDFVAADGSRVSVTDMLFAIALRRTNAKPFQTPLLTRATARKVAPEIRQAYHIGIEPLRQAELAAALAGNAPDVAARVRSIFARFDDTAYGGLPLPALIEHTALGLAAAKEPRCEDLRARLEAAENALGEQWHLFRLTLNAEPDDQAIAMDGVEGGVLGISDGRRRFDAAVAALRRYLAADQIERYPVALELHALRYAAAELRPEDWKLTLSLGLCAEKMSRTMNVRKNAMVR